MSHPRWRLLERYGISVTEGEIELLAYLVGRNMVPWEALCRGRGTALIIRVRTWGRDLYAVWCPVRDCILTFLTKKMAVRYRYAR